MDSGIGGFGAKFGRDVWRMREKGKDLKIVQIWMEGLALKGNG